MRKKIASACACIALTAAGPGSADTTSNVDAVDTFQPPVRTKIKTPTYPKHRQRDGGEGWVALSLMIDTDGVPYDITVHTSSGDPAFERAAMNAVEKWRYEPATFQGQPIDAGTHENITFVLSGASGASPFFAQDWKRYIKASAKADREAMTKAFNKMGERNRNIYEEAFYQLVLAEQHRANGDTEGEYAAVSRAAFLDNDKGYLPDENLTDVLLRKLSLELNLNKMAAAKRTIEALQRRELEDTLVQQLEKLMGAIDAAAQAEGVIKSNGRIRSDNRYVHSLLKPSFALESIEGDVAEARLHCDKGYVGFPFRAEMQYHVKADWSNCTLILIGNPETTFVLVES